MFKNSKVSNEWPLNPGSLTFSAVCTSGRKGRSEPHGGLLPRKVPHGWKKMRDRKSLCRQRPGNEVIMTDMRILRKKTLWLRRQMPGKQLGEAAKTKPYQDTSFSLLWNTLEYKPTHWTMINVPQGILISQNPCTLGVSVYVVKTEN